MKRFTQIFVSVMKANSPQLRRPEGLHTVPPALFVGNVRYLLDVCGGLMVRHSWASHRA